eukprot:TRINITY_DN6624_c0_g1_i1.p1 TRINITY_DN6624_c0_g1~~TRINITY_DN6624_c0_g1_i1.p1  ORF type:complete len:876 (+),score=158.75 TRINITY_DN6624_c0_g1_i1:102-2729(+)
MSTCIADGLSSLEVDNTHAIAQRISTRCSVLCQPTGVFFQNGCTVCVAQVAQFKYHLCAIVPLLEQLQHSPAAHIRGGVVILVQMVKDVVIAVDAYTKAILEDKLHAVKSFWGRLLRWQQNPHKCLEEANKQFRTLLPVLSASCMLISTCEDETWSHSAAASAMPSVPTTPRGELSRQSLEIATTRLDAVGALPFTPRASMRRRASSHPRLLLSQHEHLLASARNTSTNTCTHGLIAHVSNMSHLRERVINSPGMREVVETFWYKRTKHHASLQRLLTAANAASLYSMRLENRFAQLSLFAALLPVFMVFQESARNHLLPFHLHEDSVDGPAVATIDSVTDVISSAISSPTRADGPTGGGGEQKWNQHRRQIEQAVSKPTDHIVRLMRVVFSLQEIFFVKLNDKRVLYTRVRVNKIVTISGRIRKHHHDHIPTGMYQGGGVHRCACGQSCGGVSYEVIHDEETEFADRQLAQHADEKSVKVSLRILSRNPLPTSARPALSESVQTSTLSAAAAAAAASPEGQSSPPLTRSSSNSNLTILANALKKAASTAVTKHPKQQKHQVNHPLTLMSEWGLRHRVWDFGLRTLDVVAQAAEMLRQKVMYGSTSEPAPLLRTKSRRSSMQADVSVVLHFHGGGWVSMSSESHQMYVRHWTKATGCVAVSVDYSLAPDAPFPAALLEGYMAYKWVIDGGLGFVPRYVVLAGDSAGGNLATGVALKALLENIRVPDGLLLFYPALFAYAAPSPSRLLFAADPVIPRVFMEECLKVYMPPNISSQRVAEDPMISPGLAPNWLLSQLPPTRIIVGTYDPLLDDSVDFAHKLAGLDVDVQLHVHDGMPHGFLNLAAMLPQSRSAIAESCKRLAELLDTIREDSIVEPL